MIYTERRNIIFLQCQTMSCNIIYSSTHVKSFIGARLSYLSTSNFNFHIFIADIPPPATILISYAIYSKNSMSNDSVNFKTIFIAKNRDSPESLLFWLLSSFRNHVKIGQFSFPHVLSPSVFCTLLIKTSSTMGFTA